MQDDEQRVSDLKAELAEQEREMITALAAMSGDEQDQEENQPAIPSRERVRDEEDEDEEIENGQHDNTGDADNDDGNNIAQSRDDVSKDENSH